MELLRCPHCGKPGISVWDKLFMGPVLTGNCRVCNGRVCVDAKRAMMVMLPLIPVAFISWITALALLPVTSLLYIKWVPLVKEHRH